MFFKKEQYLEDTFKQQDLLFKYELLRYAANMRERII